MRSLKSFSRLSGALICSFFISSTCAQGQLQNSEKYSAEVTAALALYNRHAYKDAALAYEKLITKTTPDPTIYYYAATCNFKAGDLKRAKQIYQYIAQNFAGTTQARYSQKALESWSNNGQTEGSQLTSSPNKASNLNASTIASRTSTPNGLTVRDIHDSGNAAKYAQMFFESRSRDSKKILFIGNSLTYTNELPITLAALVTSSGTNDEIRVGQKVEGGWTLAQLFDQSDAVKAIKEDGPWTHVVLQDQSTTPLTAPASTLASTEKFSQVIKDAGAKTVMFETWSLVDQQESQGKLKEVYQECARDSNGIFVPAGEAFSLCHSEHPEINLYSDDRHPNALGTYLAACVFYKKIYGRSPVGLPANLKAAGVSVMSIDAATALILQQIALKAANAN
jgi:hypothetical protein